jgi:hypothetical protein
VRSVQRRHHRRYSLYKHRRDGHFEPFEKAGARASSIVSNPVSRCRKNAVPSRLVGEIMDQRDPVASMRRHGKTLPDTERVRGRGDVAECASTTRMRRQGQNSLPSARAISGRWSRR